jgi:hypothetical protein
VGGAILFSIPLFVATALAIFVSARWLAWLDDAHRRRARAMTLTRSGSLTVGIET